MKRCILLSFLLSCLWCVCAWADAAPIACIMTGEDVGNGYEYTVPGIGSFTVNAMEEETLPAVVFNIEDGCFPVLLRDGEPVDFNGGMVIDVGSYELRLYGSEEKNGNYGVFRFSIENDYTDTLEEAGKDFRVEKNPPLTMKYMEEKGMFRYTLPDGAYFEINVPVGGFTRRQVQVNLSDQLHIYQIYCDGEPVPFSEEQVFAKTGSYEIIARDNEVGLDGDVSYRVAIGFHIYLTQTMNISHINAPLGLTIASVSLNGVPMETHGNYLHMEEDGTYLAAFADNQGTVRWEMEFTRDTVPPRLDFDRQVDGMTVQEPVTFTVSEPAAQIHILRNGAEATASLNRIAANGSYRLEVSDQAGNVREYSFVLRAGYTVFDKRMVIIPLLLLLAAGGAFAYNRRSIRVL